MGDFNCACKRAMLFNAEKSNPVIVIASHCLKASLKAFSKNQFLYLMKEVLKQNSSVYSEHLVYLAKMYQIYDSARVYLESK